MKKFKVWDKKLNIWRKDCIITQEGNLQIIRQPEGYNEHIEKFYKDTLGGDYYEIDFTDWYAIENCIICQFTGLLDKNGKEIYEGDIIEIHDWGGIHELLNVSSIEWCSDNIGWDYTNCQSIEDRYDFRKSLSFSTVIGNIYENPELLNN